MVLSIMGDKADLSDFLLKHLIDVCKGEIEAWNRPPGLFTSTGWKNLVSKFTEKTGDKRTKIQLKNKLDNIKKEYGWFMKFKNYVTGLGWNEAKGTVDCPQEWWDEHLARCDNRDKGLKCNHLRFRKQGPKYLEDLHLIFGKAHVTGATTSCPRDISSDETSDEDVAEVSKPSDNDDVEMSAAKKSRKKKRKGSCTATEEKEEKSPLFRMYKITCLKIETAADKISSSVSASSAPPTNLVPSIGEAMKMVKECGVKEGTALMHTTTIPIMKPECREVFSYLETNKGRLDLIEREHEKKMMRRQ